MKVTIYPKEYGERDYTLATVPKPRGTFEVDTWDGVKVTFKHDLPASVTTGDILVIEN